MSTILGDCSTGHHKNCRIKIQRWYHGTEKQGRKVVPVVVWMDEYIECSCKCHKPAPVRRRRRKVEDTKPL